MLSGCGDSRITAGRDSAGGERFIARDVRYSGAVVVTDER